MDAVTPNAVELSPLQRSNDFGSVIGQNSLLSAMAVQSQKKWSRRSVSIFGSGFQSPIWLFATLAILLCSRISNCQISHPTRPPRPSNVLPLTRFYNVPRPLPPGMPGDVIRVEQTNQYSLPYEISAFRILYHSRTLAGADIAVSAVALIPDGRPPAGGWPVIAWAHEFKSLSRESAPSLLKNLGIGPLLAMYTNLGFAVVATDYAGLGADSGSAVVEARANSLDVANSVLAARAAVKDIGSKWIAVGASHGAAALVALTEVELLPSSALLGGVALSGLTDAPLKQAHAPLLVISAGQDRTVTPDVTARNLGQMCKLGDRVLLLKYPNLDSSGAISASAADQISWMKARLAGASAPSNCH